jgi:glutamyl-tRNA synthetase
MGTEPFRQNLYRAREALALIPQSEWSSASTLGKLQEVAAQHQAKLGDVMQPVRIALTGSTVSEPVNELLSVVPRETALKKIDAFLSQPSTGAWTKP